MAAQASHSINERPVYTYDLFSMLALAGFAFALLPTVYILVAEFAHYPFGFAFGFDSLIFYPSAAICLFFYWRAPIKRIVFYENHMEISGKKGRESFAYSDVTLLSRRTGGLMKGAILIRVNGRTDPISISADIMISRLKTSLYSWLVKKVPGVAGQTSSGIGG